MVTTMWYIYIWRNLTTKEQKRERTRVCCTKTGGSPTFGSVAWLLWIRRGSKTVHCPFLFHDHASIDLGVTPFPHTISRAIDSTCFKQK